MTRKDQLVNDVLVKMRPHLGKTQMSILEDTLKEITFGLEIKEEETALANMDRTNDYIIELFRVKKAKLSPKTMEQYVRHVGYLLAVIQKPLTMMLEADIERFLRVYKRRGAANQTVNNCRGFLAAFFGWMRKSKLIAENPVENVDKHKVPVKMIEHLEPEQWEKLKTGCTTTRDRALLEFLRCTAMRDGEVPAVRICDVDWYEGKLVIFGEKSQRYRLVCIDRVAKEYLMKYLAERGCDTRSREPLFVASRGSRTALTKSGIYSSIKDIAKRAKMTVNVYPHLIRKTTATNIVRRGGTTDDAGDYLGHAEKNTAGQFYTYKSEDHIVEIFRLRVAAV